jgi:hypothetical protein
VEKYKAIIKDLLRRSNISYSFALRTPKTTTGSWPFTASMWTGAVPGWTTVRLEITRNNFY